MQLQFRAATWALMLANTQCGAAAVAEHGAHRTFRDCPTCDLMTILPAGGFQMGSPEGEPGREPSEGPRHRASVAHAFALGVYDVTVTQYGRFVEATGYSPVNPRCNWRHPTAHGNPLNQTGDEPVVCVSWNDATAYVRWLSITTGHTYRLPTETEWEYAARAGSQSARPWGPDADPNRANTGAEACCGPRTSGGDRWLYTSPVGSFPPNAFGLFDMIGNVWQWTQDCGSADYAKPTAPPADPSSCETRIARGGGWFHPPSMARSAARVADSADRRVADIGFRVARTMD